MNQLKSFYLFISFFIISIGVSAQVGDTTINDNTFERTKIKKGTYFLSGVTNISGSNEDYLNESQDNDFSILSINLSPSAGIFILDNFLIGLSYDFQFNKQTEIIDRLVLINSADPADPIRYTTEKEDKVLKVKTHSVSLFTRYYFGKKQIKPFVGLEAGYGIITVDSENFNTTFEVIPEDDKLFLGALSAGANIFISKNIAIDASLFYGQSNPDKAESTAFFGTNIGFSLFFLNRPCKILN